MSKPKILLLDIETAPMLSYTWGLFDQNIGLNQINKDWHILAWSAKWLNDPASKMFYADQRAVKNIEDDKALLKPLWHLMNEADVIVTQNGISFDIKKLNARFIINGFKPPSSYQNVDTKRIAARRFGFTSNKLEYMTNKLCTKYKKLKHARFSGFELWSECLKGNLKAWKEMEKYNKYDVLSLEELYLKLQPWVETVNYNLYSDNNERVCSCGSKKFQKKGYLYTIRGKYQRYICTNCGKQHSDKQENLFSDEKRKSL